jgi:hypothetical protein
VNRRHAGAIAVAGATTLAVSVSVAVAVAAAPPAARQTLDGRGFATPVTVTFTAPPGYRRRTPTSSSWRGPRYTNIDTGSLLESTLDYSVHPDHTTRSAESAARHKIGTDIGGIPTTEVASGPIDVPHVVRGRRVGVLRGFFVIRHATREQYEGWYDAGLGFALGRGYPVIVPDFQTNFPGDDAKHEIPGGPPSRWNRQVIERALRGVAIEGNLAPARVAARIQGARVTGRVTDTLGHPSVAITVVLERRADGGWTRVAAGKTGLKGEFTLRVANAEPTHNVRVTATFAEAVARSRVLG